jgi:photosystem II stability/assembly factor-like uncharacterized protein
MRDMRIFMLMATAALAVLCAVIAGATWRSAPSREFHTNSRDVSAADGVHWSVQTSGIDTNLRGVSAAYFGKPMAGPPGDVLQERHIAVWVCGSNGVILTSTDLGKTWKRLHVTGGEDLDFRSIVAIDAKNAYVMSSGEGDKSRIYKTTDGGETWKLEFTDKRPSFFLDALVCASECYALSDPVDGKFVLVGTHNREHWQELPGDGMPAALPGEGAFAASGTALAINPDGELYFGTGGGASARVFHSMDFGKTWTTTEVPVFSGNPSSGIFSIVATGHEVVVVGGDYKSPTRADRVAAYSLDRGKTWQLAAQQTSGYRSAVVSVGGDMLMAVGPGGEDISYDLGIHWKRADSLDLNAVFFLDSHTAWAVGAKGTIARFNAFEVYAHNPRGESAGTSDSLLW